MTMADDKKTARKAAFARRKAARTDVDNCGQLRAVLGDTEDRVISGFMPILSEIDPLPFMTEMAAANTICVPVIQGAGMPLVFHRWEPGCDMVEGPFGARVPRDGVAVEPDILIVPLVAFDRRCYRLGYGGGFYDRTLEGLRDRKLVRAYGFAYGAQEADDLPLEPTDQPLDAVVTEARVVWAPRGT
jgi:5-formyltetrahydrofolate cyclo-ligase